MSRDTLSAKLSELKRLLIEARELSEISDYFSERVVDDRGFMQRGVPGRHELLEQVIRGTLRACFGQLQLHDLYLLQLSEWGFWHGAAVWRPNGVVLVAYFEGIDLGLLSIARSLADGSVHFVRFSVCAAPEPGGFMVRGPKGSC